MGSSVVSTDRARASPRRSDNLTVSMQSIVVHYQEIALKGRNRPWFIKRLVRNLREATADLDIAEVRALMGRIEIRLGPKADWDEVRLRVRNLFGIANFAKAGRTRVDLEAIATAILDALGDQHPSSFRVSVRRADKQFPLTSPQIEREVGGRIKLARGWRVNLSEPDLTIHVEIIPGEAFYYFGKERAMGGLPTGSSGRVLCLLSGGIDSPVAAYRIMKRGCRVRFLHFHSYPIVSRTSQEKTRELVGLLTKHQLDSRLYMVAFGDIQRRVVVSVPPRLRVVIYRRLMMRIADRLARRCRARALVTGEAVGQVASQTLENLAVIDAVTPLLVLRPLIGFDKEEITRDARQLGTYPISIIPDEDCCQLFTPKHPTTKARLEEIEQAERDLPVEEMIDEAVTNLVQEDFHFPARPSTASGGDRADSPREAGDLGEEGGSAD